jgi:Iron-sulfur cluster assembly accessory protein
MVSFLGIFFTMMSCSSSICGNGCSLCWAFTTSPVTITTRTTTMQNPPVGTTPAFVLQNSNHHQATKGTPALFAEASSSSSSPSSTQTNDGSTPAAAAATATAPSRPSDGMEVTHQEPEDAIIHIAPKAMIRLRELQKQQPAGKEIVLRMGVRNGGCSGLSYVMDFSSREDILEDDAVDEYPEENIVCVVDAKSMLYLYGLELDYSDALIGGGFKFFNPNAEESCGCGSSFGV